MGTLGSHLLHVQQLLNKQCSVFKAVVVWLTTACLDSYRFSNYTAYFTVLEVQILSCSLLPIPSIRTAVGLREHDAAFELRNLNMLSIWWLSLTEVSQQLRSSLLGAATM